MLFGGLAAGGRGVGGAPDASRSSSGGLWGLLWARSSHQVVIRNLLQALYGRLGAA